MRFYHVTPEAFLGAFPHSEGYVYEVTRALPTMRDLLEHCELGGKTIMGVGSGAAFEEIALLQCGAAKLVLFDIDEDGSVEPPLKQADTAGSKDAPIIYAIGDFRDARRGQYQLPAIDVLYMSGFTPDEQHRGEVSAAATAATLERWRSGVVVAGEDVNWMPGTSPFHDSVLMAIDDFLSADGLLVIQSFGYGIDVTSNPGYVRDWGATLAEHDVELLEAYYFKQTPGVTLWIGHKGSTSAAARRKRLSQRPPLTRFHYRYAYPDPTIVRLL